MFKNAKKLLQFLDKFVFSIETIRNFHKKTWQNALTNAFFYDIINKIARYYGEIIIFVRIISKSKGFLNEKMKTNVRQEKF